MAEKPGLFAVQLLKQKYNYYKIWTLQKKGNFRVHGQYNYCI